MNVASLELCKELYAVSGWEEYGQRYSKVAGVYRLESSLKGKRGSVPAYTLEYLLTMLRYFVSVQDDATQWWARKHQGDKIIDASGDTPTDAVCKLAIELWKQGILIHGELS